MNGQWTVTVVIDTVIAGGDFGGVCSLTFSNWDGWVFWEINQTIGVIVYPSLPSNMALIRVIGIFTSRVEHIDQAVIIIVAAIAAGRI